MKTANITHSEWEVMKVLWENSYLTSGQIIKEVNKENDWAKTTINSFIHRLLEKQYISYVHTKRYREYYPLMSEKECVIIKMRELTKSIYGRRLICETKHFSIFGENDPELVNIIIVKADEGYERITKILGYEFDEKQPIHLHHSQKRFHSVMGNPNAAKWYRASFIWGMIHVSPLKCFDDITIDKALMHVFTQLTISNINENCPYYLHQGISAYLGQWLSKDRIKKALLENKDHINLNTLQSFVFDLQNFQSSAGYELSYTFISYIVSKFGTKSLRMMIDNPYDLSKLFNIKNEQLLNEFKEYINKNFLD